MALLLAIVPESLSAQELAAALELLLEKLRNDITRLAAVKVGALPICFVVVHTPGFCQGGQLPGVAQHCRAQRAPILAECFRMKWGL